MRTLAATFALLAVVFARAEVIAWQRVCADRGYTECVARLSCLDPDDTLCTARFAR